MIKRSGLKAEKRKLVLATETLRRVGAGGDFVAEPSPSFIYSCVVSCTWTSDCTTSTTF